MSNDIPDIDCRIAEAEKRLKQLDAERSGLLLCIRNLHQEKENAAISASSREFPSASVRQDSSGMDKIELFMSLFRGREDVYPRRWENLKTGQSGYQPACANEWVRGKCDIRQI